MADMCLQTFQKLVEILQHEPQANFHLVIKKKQTDIVTQSENFKLKQLTE